LIGQLGILAGVINIFGHTFEAHFMVLASMLTILGFQIVNLGLYTKTYSFSEHFEKESRLRKALYEHFRLEHGIVLGALIFTAGFLMDLYILVKWIANRFGPLTEINLAILSLTFIVIGVQIIFSSFFLSMLVIERKSAV